MENCNRKNERPAGVVSENLRELLHRKEALCAELAALENACPTDDYAGEIARICAEYAACAEVPPEYSELLDRKFSDALEKAKAGSRAFEARKAAELKAAEDVERLLAAGDLATLHEVELMEQKIAAFAAAEELQKKLAPLKERLCAEAAAEKAAEEAALKLAEELAALTAQEDIAPLKERKPEIEKAFAQLAAIPRKAAQRYQEAHRKASIRLAQHFETLDLARWESYTRKLDLCAELEKIKDLPENELGKASKTLNDLREKWKTLGAVPKEKSEEINPRYLTLTREIQHRVDSYFARKHQEQKLAAAEKTKMCEEAEALASSTDWKVTAEKLQAMQAQWKLLARAARAQENELFARFHAAADRFFTARKAVLDERDKHRAEAEKKKRALIAEAENLTDVKRAKQLREEYRAAGSAGRADAELFPLFNAAMERFFAGRREENDAREKKARELLAEVEAACADPAPARERVRAIREEFRSLSCRETRSAEQNALRKFEAAWENFRAAEEEKKIAAGSDVTLALAQCYDAFKAGGNFELPAAESLTGFPKLLAAREWIEAAAAGDAKAAEKLEKAVATARTERENICAALEKLAGTGGRETPKPKSLAEELEAAIMGNFAKTEAKSAEKLPDPKKLLADFAAAGVIPAAEWEALRLRVDAAVHVIFPAK